LLNENPIIHEEIVIIIIPIIDAIDPNSVIPSDLPVSTSLN